MWITSKLRGGVLVGIAAGWGHFAWAGNIAWTNPAGGNFSTGTNWQGNLPPGLLDTASFNLASTTPYPVLLTLPVTNTQLSVGSDDVAINLQGNSYALSELSTGAGKNSLEVGSTSTAGGTLTIKNTGSAATLSTVFASIGVSANQLGTLSVAGPNLIWTAAQNINVGDSGNGTLNIQSGASVTDLIGAIGAGSGSNGSAVVTGAGSVWNSTNYFYVGEKGTGALTIQNGGEVLNAATYIGRNATGSATVTGTGSAWTTTYMDVGYYAAGTLTISGGGSVSDVDSTISSTPSGPGTVTISGSSSNWNNSDGLTVGSETAGILNIQGGAVNVTNEFAITNHAGTQVNFSGGTLTVGYFNTSSNPALFLGDGQTTGWTGGTLNITRSSLAISSTGALGTNPTLGSGKTLEVSGSGQTLSIVTGATLNAAGGSVYANTLNNAGTLLLPYGSNAEAVNPLVNTGLIDVGSTLLLDNGISGATVRSQILAAYDHGKWDGTSGITSSAAGSDATHATALAYVTTGASTKIVYTWYGDADGNGIVNSADLAAISSAGTTWQTGDFNYDGVVNSDDWSLFELGSLYGSSNISVRLPEPAAAGVLLPMAGLFLRRRVKR